MKKGWDTSDEDEIVVRKKRAKSGSFEIVNLFKTKDIFSTFSINNSYKVELRSFQEDINSCSCPDFDTNRLGTCKHIEAVKLKFFDKEATNKKIEIFLDTKRDKIIISYPKGNRRESVYRDILNPFFSSSGELLSEPVYALPSLGREISSLDEKKQDKIRLSTQIEPWLKRREFEFQKQKNRENFLEDFKDGKRSLNFLKHELFEYQKEGVLHLAFNERALLADDMGLGKTIQAIAACVLLKNLYDIKRVLIISPASLKVEWEEQIEKFTNLDVCTIKGAKHKRDKIYKSDSFFYLGNYEQTLYDMDEINSVLSPDVIILDEAQRIKNWQSKTANSIKKLQSRYAFVLTGTPIENNIDEIYSIVQFLNPHFFGPLFRFNREFYKLDEKGSAVGYKNLTLLHKKLQPIMLRRKKDNIEEKLPKKSVKNYFVQMSEGVRVRYEEYEVMVSRLASKAAKYPLSPDELKKMQMWLSCMRMLCDTPYILDQETKESPKLDELMPIVDALLEDDSVKIIIFSEWERMIRLLLERLNAKDIGIALHTGLVTQDARKLEIKKFKNDQNCRIFLSTDSGSVGLNLQVASVVINLDIPWNPAKLEQRVARAWRKNQKKSVSVINLVTENSIENKILYLIKQKQSLFDNVIDGFGEDEQPLPSNRNEIIENLKKMFTEEGEKPSKKVDITTITQDLVARFDKKVSFVARNKKNSSTIIVIDKKDEQVVKKIREISDENSQVISQEEFELIKKLDALGLVKINDKLKIALDLQKRKTPDVDNKKIIKKQLKKIEKNETLIKMLKKGGFMSKSLTLMCKNSINILQLLSLLLGAKKSKLSAKTMRIIKDKYALRDDFEKFFEKIEGKCKKKDKKLIQKNYKRLLGVVNDVKSK